MTWTTFLASLVLLWSTFTGPAKCQSQCPGGQPSVTLDLHPNLILFYELFNSKWMYFKIVAKTKGWFYIGWRSQNASRLDSDFFVMSPWGSGYWQSTDCYVGLDSPAIIEDPGPHRDYLRRSADEFTGREGKTMVSVLMERPLDSMDSLFDVPITNSTMTLLWAYHEDSDNFTLTPSVNGSTEVNFLAYTGTSGGGGGDGDGSDGAGGGDKGTSTASDSVAIASFILMAATTFLQLM